MRLKIYIYQVFVILGIVAIVSAGYFVLKRFYLKQLPSLLQIQEKISIPGPLPGPQRPTRAESLNPDEIIKWTNDYRKQNGLAVLSANLKLSDAAQKKASDMFARQYFEHTSPQGDYSAAELVKAEGYNYKAVGENLALGDFKDEKELVDAWMQSPGHRANILNPSFKEIGVSAELGQFKDRTTWIAVQIFAVSAPQCTYPSLSLKKEIEQKQAIYEQINKLYQEASDLIEQGNAKIQQGNEIYRETGDAEQAEIYWTEGKKLQKQGKDKIDEAKSLEDSVANLPLLINQYNKQVQNYNQCIAK